MGTKPATHKTCTTTCQPGCAYNPANHIPHEHFIAACSALVIALAGVIMTISPADASPTIVFEPRFEIICRDTDNGFIPEQQGSALLLNFNTQNRSVKRLSIETDSCANPRTVIEYACGKDNTSIIKEQTRCRTDEVCSNGACINKTTLLSTPSDTTTTTNSIWPSSTSPNPLAYCTLSGIAGGDSTNVRSPHIGRGYAQLQKENITTFTDLLASCSTEDFSKLKRQYCDLPNQPPFQKTAAIYDSEGRFMEFGGCEKFGGCQLYSCSDTSLLSIPTPVKTLEQNAETCSDSDGGLNADIAGTTIQKHTIAARTITSDYCLSPDTVVEHSCYSGNEAPTITSTQVLCESGICSKGACITLTSP